MSSGKTATMKYFIRNLDQKYYVNSIILIYLFYYVVKTNFITCTNKSDKMVNLFLI